MKGKDFHSGWGGAGVLVVEIGHEAHDECIRKTPLLPFISKGCLPWHDSEN